MNFDDVRRKYRRRPRVYTTRRQEIQDDRTHIGPPPWKIKSQFETFCEQFVNTPNDGDTEENE
jgi:hypothetical protein